VKQVEGNWFAKEEESKRADLISHGLQA